MSCRCNCGYRCSDKASGCDDPRCLEKGGDEPDENGDLHFVRDCDHRWDGPTKDHWSHDRNGVPYRSGCSVTCSACGMDAMAHDCAVGP